MYIFIFHIVIAREIRSEIKITKQAEISMYSIVFKL